MHKSSGLPDGNRRVSGNHASKLVKSLTKWERQRNGGIVQCYCKLIVRMNHLQWSKPVLWLMVTAVPPNWNNKLGYILCLICYKMQNQNASTFLRPIAKKDRPMKLLRVCIAFCWFMPSTFVHFFDYVVTIICTGDRALTLTLNGNDYKMDLVLVKLNSLFMFFWQILMFILFIEQKS